MFLWKTIPCGKYKYKYKRKIPTLPEHKSYSGPNGLGKNFDSLTLILCLGKLTFLIIAGHREGLIELQGFLNEGFILSPLIQYKGTYRWIGLCIDDKSIRK